MHELFKTGSMVGKARDGPLDEHNQTLFLNHLFQEEPYGAETRLEQGHARTAMFWDMSINR